MERENKPSAKFLQARIEALRQALVDRFENIVSAGLQPSEPPATSSAGEAARAPSYVDTAADQVKLEVESQALVRMAEEIMTLTRSLKDLWLFGGLDTLRDDDGEDQGNKKMQEDATVVGEAVKRYLAQRGGVDGNQQRGHENGNDEINIALDDKT